MYAPASYETARDRGLPLEKRTKTLVAGLTIAVVAFSGMAAGLAWLSLPVEQLVGTLYFNDSGEAHGGFEMAAQWDVKLAVRGGVGTLDVTSDPNQLSNGALKKWNYLVTGFRRTSDFIVMTLDGHLLQLPYVKNDTVWNRYDEAYILRTPDLDPTIFPGFLGTYYAELRLENPLIRCGEGN